MPNSKLKVFGETTNLVVGRSMKYSAVNAQSESSSLQSDIPGASDCTVSFDASWHGRGHYSNQGFAAVIVSEYGKVLEHAIYDCCCSKWPE